MLHRSAQQLMIAALLMTALPVVALTRHTARTPIKHPAVKAATKSSAKAHGKGTHGAAVAAPVHHEAAVVHHEATPGMPPERATEIQTALIKQGYLSGEPSGTWDAQTAAAMQKLQGDNGWQTKLTPDSRALIKLGLGPGSDATQEAVTPQ